MRWCCVLAVVVSLLSGGCAGSPFADEQAAWDASGIEDFTVRYGFRRLAGNDYGTVDVAVAAGEVVSCTTGGAWSNLPVEAEPVCEDPAPDPIRFMVANIGEVDFDHVEAVGNSRWPILDRLEYDDPDRAGEDLLIVVLRFEENSPRLAFWREHGPADYRIVYSRANLNGMGGSPGDGIWDVTVRDGRISTCVAEVPRRPSQVECDTPIVDPITQLFAWLRQFDSRYVDVTYHPEWQFPTLIDYDEPDGVDEEYRIQVHRFEVPSG